MAKKLEQQQFISAFDEVVAPTYGRFKLVLKSGKGAHCIDTDGNKYVDFTSGIGVNSLGFCDKEWTKAVSKQAATLQHTSNLYYNLPQQQLAATLTERTGFKTVFFANSGAEANEAAIKCARKYSYDKTGSCGCSTIVTLENSFHGRTMATITATGQEVFHKFFNPFLEGFKYAAPNMAAIKHVVDDTTCAVMIELVQGEGGVIPLDRDFVKDLRRFTAERDILLIVDEVQTGVGRTGSLFAFQQFDIVPDIVTTAKGLGAGLPIGTALFNVKVSKTLTAGTHATTFGANPVVCAGANAVLARLTPDFLAEVAAKGEYIRAALLKSDKVKAVDGMGMMLGVVVEGDAKAIAARCIERGLLVLTAKAKIRLLPPLNIDYKTLDEGLKILISVLEEEA